MASFYSDLPLNRTPPKTVPCDLFFFQKITVSLHFAWLCSSLSRYTDISWPFHPVSFDFGLGSIFAAGGTAKDDWIKPALTLAQCGPHLKR